MEKIIAFLIALLIFLGYPIDTQREPVGYTQETDIAVQITCAYICSEGFHPIQSFLINGEMYVFAEDLEKFRISIYEENNAIIMNSLSYYFGKYENTDVYYIPEGNSQCVPYYNTKTKVYYNGAALKCYEIDNKIIVPIEQMDYSAFNWITNEIYVIFDRENDPDAWYSYIRNPNYKDDVFEMKGAAVFNFKKTGIKYENVIELEWQDGINNWTSLGSLDFHNYYVQIGSHTYLEFEYKDEMLELCNFIDRARVCEDTAERREKLWEIFRVYINDEPVYGELSYICDPSYGNGYEYWFDFFFDNYLLKEDVDSVRIEFGKK